MSICKSDLSIQDGPIKWTCWLHELALVLISRVECWCTSEISCGGRGRLSESARCKFTRAPCSPRPRFWLLLQCLLHALDRDLLQLCIPRRPYDFYWVHI
jgi:hypothetical protein